MGLSRQEYWSGLPFPSPGNLPNLGTEPRSPALQADLQSELPGYLYMTTLKHDLKIFKHLQKVTKMKDREQNKQK